MKPFLGANFLLSAKTSRRLYHEAAAEEPIFDYHCHLDPQMIADNRRFDNLAELWLGGDHYKWRAMRANGIAEEFITGAADPFDKFSAWAETVPRLIGNPLYHWTHLELRRYFGITDPLNPQSAKAVWNAANEILVRDPAFSVFGIFKKFHLYAVGTTDDPADSLEWHQRIRDEGKTETKVLPSFRPDKAIRIEKPEFAAYIAKLGESEGKTISSLEDLLEVLQKRMERFDRLGCRAADHGLGYMPQSGQDDGDENCRGGAWEKEVKETFAAALAGDTQGGKKDAAAGMRAIDSYKAFLLRFLGAQYHRLGWVMELHFQARWSINSRMLSALGPDTGFDAAQDHLMSGALIGFLDSLEKRDKLPKTILFSLNPRDYHTLGTIMGAFQGGGLGRNSQTERRLPCKIQLGPAWWFCDHRDGIEEHLRLLGNVSLLSRFTGMLTDSRSFLSYPRHEYFRRILCELLGRWAKAGEIPHDPALLEKMVRDISFGNAKAYFENLR
ncbi:MAG: glucuronate isomerase [Treponema sp.]|jgi:glucuronate isomerase|nr:glucuronate isomerase [Treponema sp.]